MQRYSSEETRVLQEHLKELYQAVYARQSTSPCSANPLIVPKVDGTPRVVINFRLLNKITIRDEYPFPRIDIILNQLFGCRIHSKLDVFKPFHQIPLHSASVEVSDLSTPEGRHELLIILQGMSNSPAMFQKKIDRTLSEMIDSGYCAAFADDILHKPAESNYCSRDKKALAVVYGFRKFHNYFYETCTELHTDHRALITSLKNQDTRDRISRLKSELQTYNFEIKHLKGFVNELTDALSREFAGEKFYKNKLLLPIRGTKARQHK
ncbi:Retrovirus-related Pol polyprotein from transposon 297 [Smittium mucronatum]|uniref:Retrovirus-related Pol polyprotein from transposon 297 n=1 Tax=Smittium mucronatum TaxID=133383 RepID=A0A1R0GN32_9FUNG|nr:Retrovirus-related Pol polyprotein from transposon 297 [Smittium mucronatum]